jgi:hypothetical protein
MEKKYNTYCLDVVTSISVMIRMIKTTLFTAKPACKGKRGDRNISAAGRFVLIGALEV